MVATTGIAIKAIAVLRSTMDPRIETAVSGSPRPMTPFTPPATNKVAQTRITRESSRIGLRERRDGDGRMDGIRES